MKNSSYYKHKALFIKNNNKTLKLKVKIKKKKGKVIFQCCRLEIQNRD